MVKVHLSQCRRPNVIYLEKVKIFIKITRKYNIGRTPHDEPKCKNKHAGWKMGCVLMRWI